MLLIFLFFNFLEIIMLVNNKKKINFFSSKLEIYYTELVTLYILMLIDPTLFDILIILFIILEINKKEIISLLIKEKLLEFFFLIIGILLISFEIIVDAEDLFEIFISLELLNQSFIMLLLLWLSNYKKNFKDDINIWYIILYFVGISGIISSFFLISLGFLLEIYNNLNILIIQEINIFLSLYTINDLKCIWIFFWFFFFFFSKLYFFPFFLIYKKFILILPKPLFMLNLIVNKVLIILLFMDMYELFYLNISNNLLNFFIYLTLFYYFLSKYFMLFEKKIKDFIFFSSMSNNSFIVLNLLNNISEISLIWNILILIYYIIFMLLFFNLWNISDQYLKSFENYVYQLNYFFEFKSFFLNFNIKKYYLIIYLILLIFFAAIAPVLSFLIKYIFLKEYINYSNLIIILLPISLFNSISYLLIFFYSWKK